MYAHFLRYFRGTSCMFFFLPDQVLLDAGADLLYPDMENLAKDWKQIIELAKSTRLNEYSK